MFSDYATPSDVPVLMKEWLVMLNNALALAMYSDLHLAFVRIHPFADGNGRMARLVSNLPILKSGLPPVLIDRNRRREYLMALSAYDIEVGCAKKGFALLPDSDLKNGFTNFCSECWQASIDLVKAIQGRQRMRNEN